MLRWICWQNKNEGFSVMVSLHSEEFMQLSIPDLMIPSERVAHVQLGNNLEHALLVLTKSGYTAIPVLDPFYKLHGLLSTPMIMDSILGIERIEFEKLEEKRVEEIMNASVPRLIVHSDFKACLELLINHPFVCIENDEGVFEGILTRRTVLNQLEKHISK